MKKLLAAFLTLIFATSTNCWAVSALYYLKGVKTTDIEPVVDNAYTSQNFSLVKKSPYWRGWLIDADVMLTDYRLSNYEMTGSEGHFFKHLELVPIQETLNQIKDELKR